MANSDNAQAAIDMASQSGNLEQAFVVGKDESGSVQLFFTKADTDALIVLLERARSQLVRSLD